MQWRKLARFKSSPGGESRTRCGRMLCCGRRKDNGRSVPDLTASPGRAPPPPARLKDPGPMLIQSDFRKVSGISSEIFRQIEVVENEHDATTAAALEAVERRGEMIVRILELRQVGRNNVEAAKKFFALQDAKHTVQLVEIVKRPGQTLGLYIREGNGAERADGVFISRIALESAVYNSGCLKVGDEILAVNLVDVRHMSLDDVVIIMSIPRRLLLVTSQRKGNKGATSPSMGARSEHKPPPVVVIKRDIREDDDRDHMHLNSRDDYPRSPPRDAAALRPRHTGDGREERSRLALGGAYSPDDYYRRAPEPWLYQPPPPVVTEQPKPAVPHLASQHGYERGRTLESLAEKVHSFYQPPARTLPSAGRYSSGRLPRSGSDQQLPRAECGVDYGSLSPAARHSLLRSSLKSGSTLSRYNQRYGSSAPPGGTFGGSKFVPPPRRNRSLDYSSDTEASCPTRSPYYLTGYRTQPTAGTLGRAELGRADLGRSELASKFNSLPRDIRTTTRLTAGKRLGGLSTLLGDDPEPPEMAPLTSRLPRGRIPSSPSVFTSEEYRAWLSRAPSTSALYESLRRPPTTHYSAENIHDALKNMENASYGSLYHLGGPRSALGGGLGSTLGSTLGGTLGGTLGSTLGGTLGTHLGSTLGSTLSSTLDRPRHMPARSLSTHHIGSASGSPSVRRMRQLLELEGSRLACPNPSPVPTPSARHPRHLDINPAEFLKYKVDKSGLTTSGSVSGLAALGDRGVSGMLWLHLLAGRGLRATPTGASPNTPTTPPPPAPARDLYCVLECDRVHKARTVVRTGELQFDWDESFELDLVENRQLELLVYSWDPQHRHKLCYRGALALPPLLARGPAHQLALKIEPRGTLYIRLRHTEPGTLFRRRGALASSLRGAPPLFGAELEAVLAREPRAPHHAPVPLVVRRCVEEIERRGLDIIGLYRLCGSASKKRLLREAFERGARGADLTPDCVPDINVITGLLKDYLRELPQPLFTRCLYQMTLDALGVCLPDDPEGNAKLMASILECLPRAARATLSFLLDHLALVAAAADRNKMSPQQLATALAPPLMLHATPDAHELDYVQPIAVLKYLLQIWPAPKHSVRRGEPVHVPRGSKVSASPAAPPSQMPGPSPRSASPYRPAAAPSAASPQPALSARPSPAPSPAAHALSSAKAGQFRPQSPRTGPLPAPPRSRQVIVSSPGSPSSSSDSQSGADSIKHGGSMSSILRQPSPGASPRAPAIPGTSAGLAVTMNASTNPFLQNYADSADEEPAPYADIFGAAALDLERAAQ